MSAVRIRPANSFLLLEGIPSKNIIATATNVLTVSETASDASKISFYVGEGTVSAPYGARVVLPDGRIYEVERQGLRPTSQISAPNSEVEERLSVRPSEIRSLEPRITSDVSRASMKMAEAVLAVASIISAFEVVNQKPSPSAIADAIFSILGDSASLLFMATAGASPVMLTLIGVMMAVKGVWLIASIPSALRMKGMAEIIAVSRNVGKILGFAESSMYGIASIDQGMHATATRMYSVLYRDVLRLDRKMRKLEFTVDEVRKELLAHRSIISPLAPNILLPSKPSISPANLTKKREGSLFPSPQLHLPPAIAQQSKSIEVRGEFPQQLGIVRPAPESGIPPVQIPQIGQMLLPALLALPSAVTLSPPIQRIVEREVPVEPKGKLNCCDEFVDDSRRALKFGKPIGLPWATPMIGLPSIPILGILGLTSFAFLLLARATDKLEEILSFLF